VTTPARLADGPVTRTSRTLRVADQVIREFEDTIFGQDQVVVESQRPERVPFDLAAELHLRFDAVAVAYRKAMRGLGLAAGPAGLPVE